MGTLLKGLLSNMGGGGPNPNAQSGGQFYDPSQNSMPLYMRAPGQAAPPDPNQKPAQGFGQGQGPHQNMFQRIMQPQQAPMTQSAQPMMMDPATGAMGGGAPMSYDSYLMGGGS